jgi:hypothetical protein
MEHNGTNARWPRRAAVVGTGTREVGGNKKPWLEKNRGMTQSEVFVRI